MTATNVVVEMTNVMICGGAEDRQVMIVEMSVVLVDGATTIVGDR